MFISIFSINEILSVYLFLISLNLLSSYLASSLNLFSGVASLIVNFRVLGFQTSKALTFFFPCYSIAFFSFSNGLASGDYVNLACSITLL